MVVPLTTSDAYVSSEAVLRLITRGGLTLRLFTNDVDPRAGKRCPKLTEAERADYRPVPLKPERWVIALGRADYPEVAWSFNGPAGTFYGWYVTAGDSAEVVQAGRFPDGPYDIVFAGSIIAVEPGFEWAGG